MVFRLGYADSLSIRYGVRILCVGGKLIDFANLAECDSFVTASSATVRSLDQGEVRSRRQ